MRSSSFTRAPAGGKGHGKSILLDDGVNMSAQKMDHPEARDDVYGLLGRLCENIYDKNHQVDEHPYLPEADKDRELKRLKSKAYEILLNKSGKDYG